jgi:uncharacterized membrane protein YfhO
MLNTKFIILNPNSAPLTNRFAKGNAWFVDELIYVDNADQELATLESMDIDKAAVADAKFMEKLSTTSYENNLGDQIELIEYYPNKLTYKANCGADRLAVFSEIFYDKGWEASIDGEAADHIRVDYLLRGLVVPEGEHTVVFTFKPKTYYRGEKISYAGSIALLLFLLGAVYMELRRKDGGIV